MAGYKGTEKNKKWKGTINLWMYESASERLLWSFWPVCSIDFERVRICLRRKSVWVPIFTNKRDVESCGNY